MSGKRILAATAGAVALCAGAVACGGGDTPAPTAPPATSVSTPSSSPSSDATGTSTAASVPKQRAGTIATDEYGGRVLSVESDHAKGRPTWEVEIEGSRQGRIEVDVAKDDGDIVAMEPDNDHD